MDSLKDLSNYRVRTESDYDDFYIIDKEETKEQIENAQYFLDEIKKFLP